jgi:hypothetical protein
VSQPPHTEEVGVAESKADEGIAVTVVNEILADLVDHLLGDELEDGAR